jgi:hypothetical protein
MEQSIADVIGRQRQRVDALAALAGRFMDDSTRVALERLAGRLARLDATLAAPAARRSFCFSRIGGQLERLVRDVSLLRIDEPAAIARVAWLLAEMEESLHRSPGGAPALVYRAN